MLRGKLNNKIEKIKEYSFKKKDILILLSVYNTSYLLTTSLVQGHLIACLVLSVFIALITLYLITWVSFFKKANEEEIQSEEEQEMVRRNIRDEYLKVHKIKKKNELLVKVGCLLPGKLKKNVTVDDDAPLTFPKKGFEEVNEVRLDYINKIVSEGEIKGQPEGT